MIRCVAAETRPLTIIQMLEKNEFNTGSVHQMFQAAEGLRSRGHRLWIVSREAAPLAARAAEAGVEFLPLPLRHELDLTSIRALRHLVRQERVDVIHVHKGLSHSIALAATWGNEVPAFIVNRGVSFPLTIWNRAKYRTPRVDRIVTVCEDIRQVIIKTGKIRPDKVQVIYAGTDMSVFDPDKWNSTEFRRERGIEDDSFLFLQVGVRDWKGWQELIDSFADVHGTHPKTHLALIACKDVAQMEEVRAYAARHGVADAVTPVEYRSDIARVLASADCVVDASWAGTGITGTIREAMALGKPTVSTACGGNVELVSTLSVGWLVPPKNRQALSKAMLEVLEQPTRRAAVGRAAMDHVRKGFSRELRLDRLEELYRGIVEGNAAKGEGR